MIKTNWLRLVAIGIIFLVVAVAGFVYFFNGLRSKSKAAPTGTATLALVAANIPAVDAQNGVRVGVELDPNGATTDLYAFDVQVTFDPSKLDFQNAGGIAANVFLASGELKQQITLVNDHTIRIVGTKIATPFTTANKRVADITFQLKSGQSLPLAFNWGPTELQITNYVRIPLTVSAGASSSTGGGTATGVTMSFTPGAATYEVGNMVVIDVMLNTAGNQIGSTAVNFTYDPAKLTYSATQVNTSIFNGTVSTPAAAGGVVSLAAARNSSITGTFKVATVKFIAKTAGVANFAINPALSTVFAYGKTSPSLLSTVNPTSVTIAAPGAGTSSTGSGYTGGLGGGSGSPGEHVESNGDILHINSVTFDQAPLRYEQTVKLEEGDYILSGAARVYTARGRGVLIALACGESTCGDGKKLNDIFGKTPLFALSTDFQRKETTIHISNNQKDKKLIVRIFVEDGSEADFDFVSLTDVWGGERLTNWHFYKTEKIISPRSYPQYWDMDDAGQVLSTIDKQQGVDGALFINSSSRQ